MLIAVALLVIPASLASAQAMVPDRDMISFMIRYKEFKDKEAIYLDPRVNPAVLTNGGIRDALRLENGRIIYMETYYGPGWFEFGDDEIANFSLVSTREYKYYKRMFRTPGDPSNVYCISAKGNKRNYGHTIYRHAINWDRGEALAEFSEPITRPEYFMLPDGVVFIYGRNGLIYRWSKSDGLSRWEIDKPEDIQEKRRNMFSPVLALQVGKAACFYSELDPDFPKKELRELLVFNGQTPKRISLAGKHTGPAVALNDTNIRFCHNAGFVDVDIESGQISETGFTQPIIEGQKLQVTHLFRLPNGKLFSLWRKPYRSYRKYDIDGFENGYFNRFAEWQDGQWKVLEEGRDRVLYAPDLAATDAEGGIWMTTGEGWLKHLDIEGKFHNILQSGGLSLSAKSHMRFDPTGYLMLADPESDTIRFMKPEDLRNSVKKTATGQWRTIYSRVPIEWDKRDRILLWSLDAEEGLLDFQEEQTVSVPLPKDLEASKPLTVTRDSNHEIWIFTEEGPDRTFWRHKGEWKMFQPKKLADGKMLPSKEVAFESRMKMGVDTDYVIGRRFNKYRVSFGKDNKIVYKNEKGRVSYFDGKRWAYSRKGSELPDDNTLEQQPFFLDGVTTIYGSENGWNLTDEQWNKNRETDKPRPWNSIESMPYPFEGEQYFNIASSYPDGPFSEDEASWGYRASNILNSFVRAHDKLGVHYPSGYWNILPANGTPFESNSSFDQIWIDKYNRWFFQFPTTNNLTTYVVYEPPKTELTITNPELGSIDQPYASVLPQWTSTPELKKAKYRYRIEDGEWSEWVSKDTEIELPGFSEPGQYEVQVQVHSESRPMKNQMLAYQLNVKYSLEDYITPLIEQLQSDQYQTRRKATEELLTLGEPAIPFLNKLLSDRDAEVRMTAEMLIKLLEFKKQNEENDDE